jgi:hypothetical protein
LISWYSSLKSTLFPTKILGTFPTFSVNYGYHFISQNNTFCRALTNEEGSTTEKTIRKTSQCG